MRKIFIVCASVLFTAMLHAQNVGIGTLTPTEKLEIKNTLRSTLKISSGSYDDTTQLIFSNKINPTTGTDFSITSIKELGLFFSSSSDIAANNSPNTLVILPAGNIGIGTNVPAYRFQVHDPVAANNYMNISNSTTGSSATDGLLVGLTGNSAILNNLENGNLKIGTNNLTRVMIEADGDVGIGTASPLAKFHVNGAMKIEGLNTLEFGAGVAGKEINAGKIGYQTFTVGALDIIGAGTTVANRKVNIFAEGGTTFNGPINVGGSTGTAGQVLTSNGTAAPSWNNAAYSNNIRFAVTFTKSPTSPDDYAVISSTFYNLNTTEIVISSTGITINRSGLYHFDLGVRASMSFATAHPSYPAFDCWLYTSPSTPFNLIDDELMRPQSTANTQFLANGTESLEVYITAPVTIRVKHIMCICGSTFYDVYGYLSGHLISE